MFFFLVIIADWPLTYPLGEFMTAVSLPETFPVSCIYLFHWLFFFPPLVQRSKLPKFKASTMAVSFTMCMISGWSLVAARLFISIFCFESGLKIAWRSCKNQCLCQFSYQQSDQIHCSWQLLQQEVRSKAAHHPGCMF